MERRAVMTLYMGIEQSPDPDSPHTKITRFYSGIAAQRWLDELALPALLGGSSPAPARQRNVYVMPQGWKPPKKREINQWVRQYVLTSPKQPADALAAAVRRDQVGEM